MQNNEMNRWSLGKTGAVAALTVLTWVSTMFVRIPIPATTGYFNLGDIFVILAGLWLGGLPGLLVGAVGSTIADAIGYPQFIVATLFTKGVEGFLVGVISGGLASKSVGRKWAAAFSGAAVVVAGYFIFEAVVYPWLGRSMPFFNVTTYAQALVEILPNSVQGAVGAMTGIGLWKALAGLPRTRRSD